MKIIRIFISSPGDVAEERERARQVVEQLRHRYAGQFDLKPVLWEDLPLQADMSFQQGIDAILSKDRGIDIAIFILWSRLGSPLGAVIRKPDGSSYRSGTEREFDLMMAAREHSQTSTPKILVYTRNDPVTFLERLRGKRVEEQHDLISQRREVESFIQENFRDSATGTNIRAHLDFDHPVTFSKRLRIHLQEILDPQADDITVEPVWDIAKLGSPFRGLEAYEFIHNSIFFGREDEVLEVRRALQKKAQEGCAFVLISGASGSGKSSLARAGVLPAIVENEVDSTLPGWRFAICTPSQLGGNLCHGLARLLCSEGVLPELKIAGDSIKVLGEGFATAPKLTVDQSLRPALMRATQGKTGTIRLLLLIDQLEELFTDKGVDDQDREQFVAALESLARSGLVWVLGTVRSDFYQHCQQLPVLMRMKEGPGQVDLLLPTPDALRRLIVQPARLACLTFEERDSVSLADRILNDAAAHTELLPLVSYLLRELFEQRTPKGVLPWDTYQQLGGVEGALAKRAETVFSSLPDSAQRELNHVLRALVSVSGDDEESVVRQRAPLEMFRPHEPARILVDRFVAERFLVTDAGVDGKGSVAVAHEALLRVWNRAAQWITDNREFLRVRARVAARMKEGSRILDGDPLLEAARFHLANTPEGFTPELQAFIDDSVRAVEQARHRRVRRLKILVAGFAVLAAAAMLAGIWAISQKHEVVQTLSQSDFLQAELLLAANNQDDALAHLSRSLSANPGNEGALIRLATYLTEHSWEVPTLILKHNGAVCSAQFSPDGKRIVTASYDGTARVWDAQTGQPLTPPMKHNGAVISAQFSPDGTRIVTASYDGTAMVWDSQSGQPLTQPMKHEGRVVFAQFSPDGTRIVTASWDNTARVWDAQTGQPLTSPMKHDSWVVSAQFSPDGRRIVTVSGNTARVWDARTGQPLTPLMVHKDRILSAQFSPDGKWIVTASYDRTARVWNAQTGQPLTQPLNHGGPVNSTQFSPDGMRIVTASYDRTARVWDAQTGQPLTQPMKHNDWVFSAEFSPDGKRIVTASVDGTARVWDAQTGRPLMAEPMKHKDVVCSAQFSPDGKKIVTASWDDTARVWDAQTGQPLTEPMKHSAGVLSAQFSSDGKWIVTAAADGTARVWDAQTGQPLTDPLGHIRNGGPVSASAQFSPDGRRIVVTSEDYTARVYDVAPVSSKFPDWLPLLAQAISGYTLNQYSVLVPTKLDRAQTLKELNKSPSDDDWTVWGRWFLADPATRTISPFSQMTVPQYTEDLVQENTTNSLNEAEPLAFGNTNLLQQIFAARQTLEQGTNSPVQH
ncbi:MAG TPA: AAA family ATPase [Candidatus Aquilonibacter sp.]|nr:AAA family ATPase [Candidatus Aquilonibacter sp.]